MEVIRDGDPLPRSLRGAAVTVGVFDGVHRGHQAVLARLAEVAAERGVPRGVVTFDRNPASIVRPDSAPRVLTTARHRLELFEAAGLDFVRLVTFDEDRSLQSAGSFASEVLSGELGVRAVVVGSDFHFGLRRQGDVGSLGEIGDQQGFELIVLPALEAEDGGIVTSALVRQSLAAGDVRSASALLGRPYEVRGVVERGDQRGRTLGYPTANVAVGGDVMLPADGVYAGRYVHAGGAETAAAISIGRRPTFYREAGLLLVEAHLLDFTGDLYGQRAAVMVTDFVRGQERFDSAEELIEAMDRDLAAIRALG